MNFKSFFLVFLMLHSLFPSQSFSQVFVKPPGVKPLEFRAYVQSLGGKAKSFSKHLLLEKRKEAESHNLKSKFLQAQEFYLSGEEKKAMRIFNQIIELALSADWNEKDRRIILYSFLRLAQIEKEEEKKKALLISARDFSLKPLSRDNYKDYDLFPPPLMKRLEALETISPYLTLDIKTLFPGFDVILINGERVKKERIKLQNALYRVSAFSSFKEPWSETIRLSELLRKKIKTESLTTGFCANLKLKKKWKDKDLRLMPQDCNKNSLALKKETFKEIPLKSLSLEEGEEEKEKKTLSLQTWILIGAGVAVLGFFLLGNSKDSTDQELEKHF